MFYFDPLYMVLMGVGAIITFIPQMWVKNTYKKFSQVSARMGMTGAEVARRILEENRIHDVNVEMVPGTLSDHYDPRDKTVRLSQDNYSGSSVAGIAVAAHEVGHAIQHATGYSPVVLRSAMVPAVNLGSRMGPILIMISLFLGYSQEVMPDWAMMIAWAGVFIF